MIKVKEKMAKKKKNIGIDVPYPEKECDDKKCPFHGRINVRLTKHIGKVTKTKTLKDAIVEWERPYYIPKYERYEKRRTKLKVHNPPCINAKVGDTVEIRECRKLSKTKNFVIVKIMK